MPTDATGSPTPLGIPKYNVSVDPPSGIGFNNTMDVIDTIISGRIPAPAGIASGEVPVWNGSAWVRSSVTQISASSLGNAPSVPTGAISPFAGSTAPTNWVLADGSAISRGGANAALFTLISTTYGVGDGSTTFNVPDLRGRMPVGKGSNANNNTLGQNDGVGESSRTGGKHTHSHTLGTGNDTPDHVHNEMVDAGGAGGNVNVRSTGAAAGNVASNSNTGGASARHTHPITGAIGSGGQVDTPAFLVINFIIKL